MKRGKTQHLPHFYSTIFYVTGLFLFLEWLYPIPLIGTTETILPFVVYTVFCFLITLLRLPWFVSFLLKGFGLLFLLNALYTNESFLDLGWIDLITEEMTFNVTALLQLEMSQLTPFFSTFLAFLLIWLMSYLLYYWFVQMRHFLVFIVLTVLYVTILDTFTMYAATNAIIRVFIFSIIGLTLANLTRELDKEQIPYRATGMTFRWFGMLVVTVLFSLFIGISAPKYEPQWPDPVPFMQTVSDNLTSTGNEKLNKVGYSEDDSELGGSFIQDDTPVFRAEVFENHYWRVEVKDYYTGKGWEMATNPVYLKQPGNDIQIETFSPLVETEERVATVTFNEDEQMEKLVYPYGLKWVATDVRETNFYVERSTEAIEVMENNTVIPLATYQHTYEHPSYSVDALLNSSDSVADMLLPYLQLPENLPQRVTDLAEEITSTYETKYEKVKAIEQYFNQNGFSYQTIGIPIPGEDDDYVDQFLFETKVGYCDNYSTAMVVMLRTLDIPARWAKGFTSGELIERGDEHSADLYEITNSNAHSWVEVYFNETGWVPFEPTQGFTNPTDFYSESDVDAENEETAPLEEMEQPQPDEVLQEENAEEDVSESEFADERQGISWFMILTIGVLLVISYFIYRFRFKLQANWYKIRLEREPSEKSFQAAYFFLLKLLEKKGHHRPLNQTLRAYAREVDNVYGTDDMVKLTHYYEAMIYRNSFDPSEMNIYTEIWKNVVKKLTS